ncbi:MAG: glycosyltransferase [Odoribacteraceae bacterium]|jgi:uncharacterized protein (TIGR00661 family)|nr:glycosyltransferase [Odoribacteraceae bacterium]
MKFLFVVQGEGRGHLTQALATRETLTRAGHEVTGILVGKRRGTTLPPFFVARAGVPVETFDSVYFVYSRKGKGAMFARTIARHAACWPAYARSVWWLRRRLRECDADVVINFYEVLAGVTYALFRPRVPCVCVAHQYLFLHPGFVPPPRVNRLEAHTMLLFTRLTAARATRLLALSFREMPGHGKIRVIPPRVRQEARQLETSDGGYVLGYLLDAGFATRVVEWHERFPDVPLRFFWKQEDAPAVTRVDDTLAFYQLDDVAFLEQMAGCMAYACTGGFESVCEAMFLGKPVMMVPAHVEQSFNAFDATRSGAGVAARSFDLSVLLDYLPHHVPSPAFVEWTNRSDSVLLDELAAIARERGLS